MYEGSDMAILLVTVMAVGMLLLLRPWPFFASADQSSRVTDNNVAADFGRWVQYRAKKHGLNVWGVARPVALECPKCGKSSNYFVYPEELCERCWRATLNQLSTPAGQPGK
jgi:hypothetical protein